MVLLCTSLQATYREIWLLRLEILLRSNSPCTFSPFECPYPHLVRHVVFVSLVREVIHPLLHCDGLLKYQQPQTIVNAWLLLELDGTQEVVWILEKQNIWKVFVEFAASYFSVAIHLASIRYSNLVGSEDSSWMIFDYCNSIR